MLHCSLAVLTIGQRKRHYKVSKGSNMQYKLYLACTKVDTQFLDNFHRVSKKKFRFKP